MSQATPSPVTNGDTREKRTDRQLIATPHKHLGTDAEGYAHHANEQRGVVHRIAPDGEIARVTDLDGAHLDEYIDFVANQLGWEDRRIIKAERLFGGLRR